MVEMAELAKDAVGADQEPALYRPGHYLTVDAARWEVIHLWDQCWMMRGAGQWAQG